MKTTKPITPAPTNATGIPLPTQIQFDPIQHVQDSATKQNATNKQIGGKTTPANAHVLPATTVVVPSSGGVPVISPTDNPTNSVTSGTNNIINGKNNASYDSLVQEPKAPSTNKQTGGKKQKKSSKKKHSNKRKYSRKTKKNTRKSNKRRKHTRKTKKSRKHKRKMRRN